MFISLLMGFIWFLSVILSIILVVIVIKWFWIVQKNSSEQVLQNKEIIALLKDIKGNNEEKR